MDLVTISREDDSTVFYYDNYLFKAMHPEDELKISIDFRAVKDEKTNALFVKANKEYESSNSN